MENHETHQGPSWTSTAATTQPVPGDGGSPPTHRLLLLVIVVAWLGVAWWIRHQYLPYDVSNTDVGTCRFQAETFAAGQLDRQTPEPREFFQQWQAVVRDRSYAYYPPVHALLLAIPLAVGWSAWLVPWLCGGASLLLLYAWSRRLMGAPAAMGAVVVLALSPFFAANAPSLLMHSTGLFLTLVVLGTIVRWQETGAPAFALAAGLLLGLLFAHRSLNAVALGAVWLPWVAWSRRSTIRKEIGAGALCVAGGLSVVGLLALYYHALSGRWTLELFTDYWPRNRYGFGTDFGRGEPGHFFQTVEHHDWTGWCHNLGYYSRELVRWWTGSATVSILLAAAVAWAVWRTFGQVQASSPGLPPKRDARPMVLCLLAWPLLHTILYAFYFTPSVPDSSKGFAFLPGLDAWLLPQRTGVTGPRYLFEISPAIAALSGLGGAWLFARQRVAFGILAGLTLVASTWFKVDYCHRNQARVPRQRLVEDTVREKAKPPALVFIRSFWLGHPFPIFLNRPGLSDPILFACDRGGEDRKLVERHPERNAFVLAIFPPGKETPARVELIPIYDAATGKWLADPATISAPFWIGGGFTRQAVQLEGETARQLFHPRPEEIVPQ